MYFLFYIDNHHDSINFLSKFSVFNKEKIAKHFFKHEKLLLIKANAEQQKIFEYAFKVLNDNAEKYPLTKRGWNRQYADFVLDRIQKDGIPFKIFKHEAEVKDFANDKKSTKTKPKNATISKKTTKKEGKTMATWKQVTARNLAKARRKKRQSKALSSKGLTGTLTRVKKLLFGKGRIRSTSKQVTNTRYVGRIAKGKYIYRVKKIK